MVAQPPLRTTSEVAYPDGEMTRKALFYRDYGVEEYYLYDPDGNELSGWVWGSSEGAGEASAIATMQGWVSPRLGIRFEPGEEELKIYGPQGNPFLTTVELAQQRDEAQARAGRLAEKLRELGVDPDEV